MSSSVIFGSPRVLIDGLNVAYWCGTPPSLRVPLTLMMHLLAEGLRPLLYFDASAPYRLPDEAELYSALLKHPSLCISVQKGTPADREILKQAQRQHAQIISRDKFRDHRKKFRRLIDDPTRICSGLVSENRVQIPALSLDIPLLAETKFITNRVLDEMVLSKQHHPCPSH